MTDAEKVFDALRERHPGRLFVFVGPSGAGKSTVCGALIEGDARLGFSVSHTTRPPRPGEEDGREYYFAAPAAFEAMAAAGGFAEHATVHGHRYGTARAELAARAEGGKDVVLDIDVQGARQIRAAYPEAVIVFILPPSLAALEERLTTRGQNEAGDVAGRLERARAEIAAAFDFDYVIVNDCLAEAVGDAESIIRAERHRAPRSPRR